MKVITPPAIEQAGYELNDRFTPPRWLHPKWPKFSLSLKLNDTFYELRYTNAGYRNDWWVMKYQRKTNGKETYWGFEDHTGAYHHAIRLPEQITTEQMLLSFKLMTEMDRIFEYTD
jgi:hypothetical protein